MRKLIQVFREILHLVKRHRVYFLLPLLAMLGILVFLVGTMGAGAIVAFIYAGI